MEVLNDLLEYNNLKIYQNTNMFSFSLDSVLLARFVIINKNVKKILDIGTGNAPIPLILSTLTNAKIVAIEIQKDVYDLAKKNVIYNHLQDRIDLMNGDINEQVKTWNTEMFDIITCNPPFFKVTENVKLNESEYKKIARHEIKLNLEQIIKISKKLLKNNGSLNIVHRPERLIEIITLMKNNGIEPKRIKLVYPKNGENANILLIEGVKMGKSGLKIEPPLIVHNIDGSYTDEVINLFK